MVFWGSAGMERGMVSAQIQNQIVDMLVALVENENVVVQETSQEHRVEHVNDLFGSRFLT